MWPSLPFILPEASSTSARVDAVFFGITLVILFFALGVAAFVIFFAVRYRQGTRVNRAVSEHEGIALELTWSIIPLIMAMALFVWSTSVYFSVIRPPAGAMEINVVGKQWMWKLQHPEGRWEMDELHVPKGRAIKLTMISEDVVHDFGLPAFRIKEDVIPGRYTQEWFLPTRVGRYHMFCSQFCGTNHATMGGYVYVMEPQDYQRWLASGNSNHSFATAGEKLFRQYGCTGCHGADANVRAPSLEGLYGHPVALQLPNNQSTIITADNRYIHDSIVEPMKDITAGYKPIMPSYKGRITEEEIVEITEYIKSLANSNGTGNGFSKSYTGDNYIDDARRAYDGFGAGNQVNEARGGLTNSGVSENQLFSGQQEKGDRGQSDINQARGGLSNSGVLESQQLSGHPAVNPYKAFQNTDERSGTDKHGYGAEGTP